FPAHGSIRGRCAPANWLAGRHAPYFLLGQKNPCENGFCRHPVGDLLVGRGDSLTASSTCGLFEPQKYCIIGYLEDEQKCFTCDSRYPYNPVFQAESHLIENVITTFEPDRKKWWQSENGVDHVSIRLDLENLFQFSHLILTFKTFRPAAMLVERSTDYGQTWKVFRYFAQDCATSFPDIPSRPATTVGDVVCDSRYSDIEPSTEGEVVFKALDPSFEIEDPYAPYIQELITLTNLRINFTKLHTLGDTLLGQKRRDPLEKYYYALYEMIVRGSCFCNGHASYCGPVQNLRGDVFHEPGMVHGSCLCEHNTDGLSCERCKDFYNDAPWRPAEGSQENACQKCECNGHSESCHFDMAVYLSNNRISGGVCEDCQHNTMGQHCDRCKLFFYQDPERTISDPRACIPCECDPEGTLYNGLCEDRTDPFLGTTAGQCHCKENVEGVHCDKCKPNYYGLSGSDPLGCQRMFFFLSFSSSSPLKQGYWGLGSNLHGCSPCGCDIGGAHNNLCAPTNGQCECLPNIVGRQCSEPAPGYFFLPLDYYIYEAEDSMNPALDVVIRESVAGKPVTWSGPGFVRVRNGAGLRFTVNNIPFLMDFNIIIRYEPEVILTLHTFPMEGGNNSRLLRPIITTPLLKEIPPTLNYTFFMQLFKTSLLLSILKLGLIPRISSVENFCDKSDLEEYQQYHCIEIASEIGPHILPEACEKLIASLSARIHNGAVCKYQCHPQGSMNSNCEKLGGQCQCKPNVMGRCCDKCSAGSHSFGSQGCLSCDCHPQGSVSALCDQVTGQCSCRPETDGRRCSQCLAGYFGFPHCRPCPCNGFAELCDAQTGACLDCRGFTAGANCERCVDGYYGNPLKGEPCRPCMCPDAPTSSRYFAHSCYQDPWTLLLVCNCLVGYSGDRCDECPGGFYRNPNAVASQCLPCSCNNNIDVADPDSCNKDTGECLKCLHNTHGPSCEFCKPGYFGSALLQNCRKCDCNPLGVDPVKCPSGNGFCLCDQMTGICPCLPHVVGTKCDQCAAGYWNMIQGTGCRICDCNPRHSQNNLCDQLTGQCPCKVGYTGRRCDACDENYFGDSQIHCFSCKCSTDGTLTPGCDKDTGACNCRVGVTGRFCDQCARGYIQEFPSCRRCHVCFDQWDNAITSLSQKIQKLMRFAAMLGDKRQTMPGCDVDLKGHEDTISEIERILKNPTLLPEVLLSMKKEHGYIRQKVSEMYQQPDFLDQFPDLNSMIEGIRKDADHLSETLQKMSDTFVSMQICGLPGNFPCGVSDCGGALCRDSQGNRHCGGPNCNGALPLSTNAIREGRQTVLLLNNLTNQMQGSEEKVPHVTAILSSLMAEELEKNKDQIERERENIKELIKRLKNFLLGKYARNPFFDPPVLDISVVVVSLFSRVRLFVTPWTRARQALLSSTASRSLVKLMLVASRTLSNHLVLCRPLLLLPSIFPSIRVFSRESSLLMRWPKYWSLSFRICPSSEHSGLISFRMERFDLLAVHGTLKSLLQHHNSKASVLRRSAFFMVQLSLPYITTGKTIALTIRTFVGKVMSLLFKMLSRFVIAFLPRYICIFILYVRPRILGLKQFFLHFSKRRVPHQKT
uniref:Laminin subunit beta 4 n=1 Tax=Podarcis muralis TaxID=64176 RepID=A0A670J355_PODMU